MPGRAAAVSDRDILAVFVQVPGEALGTADVAEACDYSHENARRRLDALQGAGYVDCRLIGGACAWWLTDAGREYVFEHSLTRGRDSPYQHAGAGD